MNDMYNFFQMMLKSMINQAIINKEKQWKQLPQDQQEALDKLLCIIDDIDEYKNKIQPQYQQQALEAIVIKIASKMNPPIVGGYQR